MDQASDPEPVIAGILTGRAHMTFQRLADGDGMWELCRSCGDLT